MNDWRLDPRLADDSHPVAQLPLCELRLMDDSHHPWLVTQVSRLLREGFAPDKLNVAALGNVVPQLHVHVIARYTGDIAWPRPVWGQAAMKPYTPEALVERIAALREGLAGA